VGHPAVSFQFRNDNDRQPPNILHAPIPLVVKGTIMQTLDFTRGLTEIVAELKVRELYVLLEALLITVPQNTAPNYIQQQPLLDDVKKTFASLLFASHAGYDRLSRVETTRRILEGMNASELYEPGRLGRVMNLVTSSGQIGQLRGNNPGDI
jgi:hypothetical protein